MSVPTQTSVLVVGGGPAGSYAASCLAREGVDTVVLEADKFPRYHVGESMIASIRHFFRFIDLDEEFDKHGFRHKVRVARPQNGAVFKLNSKPEVYTDFVAAGGPDGYAYNVIRSEADHLIFKHAAKSGAQTFDQTKVESIEFEPTDETWDNGLPNPGRPVSAKWSRKDGSSGVIKFDDLIDASGRVGMVTTKYLKNRKYNQGLKNVASWGYFKNTGYYGVGTYREGQPYFEALQDASGWVWTIPLHDGTTSVGVVRNQAIATQRKKEMNSPSSKEFYFDCLQGAPGILKVLGDGELISDIKNASDWSYSASAYASPHIRVAGDAGCFIDPFFSSGVHLALTSGLSAATTICAVRRGDCDEATAAKWHSTKVGEGYTRFLLVVLSAMKQIREADEAVLSDFDEEGFDRAFAFFRPIIQGTSDLNGKLTQAEISKTVDFCVQAFRPVDEAEKRRVLQKLEAVGLEHDDAASDASKPKQTKEMLETKFTDDEMHILNTIRGRQMLRSEDTMNIENLAADVIDGKRINLERGALGLSEASGKGEKKGESVDVMALIIGEEKPKGLEMERPAVVSVEALPQLAAH
ncbi:MAG: hypothetical protein L6R39_000854 [Caloplaca ligustica]|nr:MAG: hypothetical protein L6R39_000854 [Caloplaca ligustica]